MGDHFRGFRTQGIREGNQPRKACIHAEVDYRAAFLKVALGLRCFNGNAVFGQQFFIPGKDLPTLDASGDAQSRQHGKLFCLRDRALFRFLVTAYDGLAQRMLGSYFRCGGEGIDLFA